ncbi:PIG-L family deacetylase [Granulosicoccus antarcticus]|uniref:Mycothiol S-conjugate amidase n=1 Tax=Granulosicoccus antarcticus IMCC3135 TaxID=1192854 RepID=A0A2Z2NW71_9GAMM|nr:PIG-L family deacetylase [Granulosicoccus antarcticus]ASJ75493.1 Mycothiol S-conjugate amidase [Granulosicoccus antarcticus IMCC3135]
MPLADVDRLDAERAQPRIVALHFALTKLRSCVSFMNSGAHPDDEVSSMLAALGFRDGLDISYACANRGEGGQNDIGTESLAALGTLRTAEMEEAARVLDLRLYWLSQTADDSIFDFGFSKSGEETLEHWQYQRTLHRFVSIVRQEKPDILCPTFLDIPGQHGHHRAMTALAHEVMDVAADASYSCDSLDPWQISKLYLPAWGGGGTAYDDEEPPPPATLLIQSDAHDSVTGWTWENIGQQSRRFHQTQAMGRWVESGTERNWPLHLARSRLAEPDTSIFSGLASTLGQLAEQITDSPRTQEALQATHLSIEACLEAFPDFRTIAQQASQALVHLRAAMKLCPDQHRKNMMHRLERKQNQLSTVIRLALGIRVHTHLNGSTASSLSPDFWQPGEQHPYSLEIDSRESEALGNCQVQATLRTEAPWSVMTDTLVLDSSAEPSNAYPDTWLPDQPASPCVQIDVSFNGVDSSTLQSLDSTPVVLPAVRASLSPAQILVNTALPLTSQVLSIASRIPDKARAQLNAPSRWQVAEHEDGLQIDYPENLEDGLYELPLSLDALAASQVRTIAYPHVSSRVLSTPAIVRIRALNIKLPDVRIAYAGGGNDDVASWLSAMGLPVKILTETDLEDASSLARALATVDTLVIGLFAYRSRPQLSSLSKTINLWVEQGGHLLTLYHRPWDNWDPELIPPRRLEIGQPSLRYRVTNQNAAVSHLQPEHPLLNTPNRIGPADWVDWKKERGLYFAKSWDDAYTPLLSMADPGEEPHTGALLSADIGQGRHIHTSLILHHQLDQLVPGSFRLMANLVS